MKWLRSSFYKKFSPIVQLHLCEEDPSRAALPRKHPVFNIKPKGERGNDSMIIWNKHDGACLSINSGSHDQMSKISSRQNVDSKNYETDRFINPMPLNLQASFSRQFLQQFAKQCTCTNFSFNCFIFTQKNRQRRKVKKLKI